MNNSSTVAGKILHWYDQHARMLPWRVSSSEKAAGASPDPYFVWLSEVMLQQTTVATVSPYFKKFIERWPNVHALATAPLDEVLREWAGLGYYARARNLHKCAQAIVADFDGVFPDEADSLRKLPGVGEYTAAAIAAIAFDQPATVVDGNVERVIARLFKIEAPLPEAKPAVKTAAARLTPAERPGDYAQAVMDLGATVCTPTKPACGICPLMDDCEGRRAGVAAELPRKKPKAEKPTRRGVAYLAIDGQGRVLLRRRPAKGLLGGMMGLPGGDWRPDGSVDGAPPFAADWRDLGVEVRHTFTHFHLKLMVEGALVSTPARLSAEDHWISRRDVFDQALPTLMKKALKMGLPALDRAIAA